MRLWIVGTRRRWLVDLERHRKGDRLLDSAHSVDAVRHTKKRTKKNAVSVIEPSRESKGTDFDTTSSRSLVSV